MFVEVGEKFHRDDRAVYLRKTEGHFLPVSYAELRETVECLMIGLKQLGMEAGDRIGIVSENRLEWVASDFAILCAGAVDVPVFPTLTERQMEFIYANCSASILIVSNRLQLQKILNIREQLPGLEHIVVMNDDLAQTQDFSVHRWSDVISMGRQLMPADQRTTEFLESVKTVASDDLCTIIYTSGTTGQPKGVMLSHSNLCANINAINELIHVGTRDVFLSYLPMCHSYERIAGFYIAFAYGATTAFAESLETVRTNLLEVRPTVLTSVPRLFERIRNGVMATMEKQSPLKKKLFQWSLHIGQDWIEQRERGNLSLRTKALHRIADTAVFSKVRQLTGGQLRFFVSGGGALSADVKSFFTMMGMTILEGYGLTESSPVIAVTVPEDDEIGTVGKPLQGVQVRLADDGEILAKGPNIMKGYWNDPQATKEAIDEEGWLHTGDVGMFTARGNLKITDRKKNIFVSSGGKNIAPQLIENAILQSRFVDQVFIIGEKRPYCTALVVVDIAALHAAGLTPPKNDVSSWYQSQEVRAVVWKDIQHVQRDLAKYERVRKFLIVDEAFSVENGMMTPTLKLKRKVIEAHYAEQIAALYEGSEHD